MKRLLLAILLLAPAFAFASQNSLVTGNFAGGGSGTSPYPGSTLVSNLNTAFPVISSFNSGASAPSYKAAYMPWFNTTPTNPQLEIYDGANWQTLGFLNLTTSQFGLVSDGVPTYGPVSTGSSNAYVVTYAPAPTALQVGHTYSFITNFSNTGAATVNFNSLGALPLKKNGGTALASGDLGNGAAVSCIYDGTNCQITSEISTAGTGTVTSVSADGTVLSGTVTGSGSFTRANASSWSILSNSTSASAAPSYTSTPLAQAYYLGTTQATSSGKTGVHSPSSGAIAMEANGNDALFISTSSYVGIGTLSPASLLQVGSLQYPSTDSTAGKVVTTNGSGVLSLASTRMMVTFGNGGTEGVANNTYFLGTSCLQGGEGFCNLPFAIGGTISNMTCNVQLAPGTGNSITFTMRVNASAGNETCTVSNSATSCTDSTHTDVETAGNVADIGVAYSASATGSYPNCSVELSNP